MNTDIVIGPIRLERIAHGGHFVGHYEGRVVFVRHGLPGELVKVRVTDSSKASFWRGDVVEVLESSPDRVQPPCSVAGRCGGCDFQHISLTAQRKLKGTVIAEQLCRLAGIKVEVVVQPVVGDLDGLGWRTRMRYQIADGKLGLRAHRSNEVVSLPISGCLIAAPQARKVDLLELANLDGDEALVSVSDDGLTATLASERRPIEVTQCVRGRRFRVRHDGFWQSHAGAPRTLVDAVIELANPKVGQCALDLYCGVGLFAGALADFGVRVTGVELDRGALGLARRNVPEAKFESGRVEKVLGRLPGRTDVVILDPPRTGAGKAVVTAIAARRVKSIIYVACDPASLGRDLATFKAAGYELNEIRAFDLFPMTQHVECVAKIARVNKYGVVNPRI